MNKKYSLNVSHFSDYIHISNDALRHCQTQGLAYNRLCRSVRLSVCPCHLFPYISDSHQIQWKRVLGEGEEPLTH